MEFTKRYSLPEKNKKNKQMLAASMCGIEGEPGCPQLSQVATIVGGHESRARSALIAPLKKKKKRVSKPRDSSSTPPHPPPPPCHLHNYAHALP